jgi:hypothetical protein
MKYLRYVLTIALIYGVYTEAGIWTALSITLINLYIECLSYTFKH